MRNCKLIIPLFLCLFLTMTYQVNAAPILSLSSPGSVEQGGTSTLDIGISEGTESFAGVNAKILLPSNVSVTNITKGALLATDFKIDSRELTEENGVSIIAYSSDNTFSNSGTLLTLNLSVADDVLTGTHNITFASNNANPVINTKHSVLSLPKGSGKAIRRLETPGKTQVEVLSALNHYIDDSGVLQPLSR